MTLLRLSIVLLLALSGVSAQALEWKQKQITAKSDPGSRAADAVFPFTNTGTTPVTIIAVTTSCECTTAVADKTMVAVGQSGTIAVHFEFEGRTGENQRTILVLALENGVQVVTSLKFNVTILATVDAQPRMLGWNVNEEPAPKVITVTLLDELQPPGGFQATPLAVKGDDFFAIELRRADEKGLRYSIIITPKSTEKAVTRSIALKSNTPILPNSPIIIQAIIR
jgi:hypothetical protein